MGKKASDAECRENYEKMCAFFQQVVPDQQRFKVVYGCGMDVGVMNFVVARRTTYTYSSYMIGFDAAANEITLVPIDLELDNHAPPIYLKNSEIIKAKQSWLSKEITIRDNRLPKKYIQFSVPEMINDDPDNVCLLVKQNEEAKAFLSFFKNQYAK